MDHEGLRSRTLKPGRPGRGLLFLAVVIAAAVGIAYARGEPVSPRHWRHGVIFVDDRRLEVTIGSSPVSFTSTPWTSRTEHRTWHVLVHGVRRIDRSDPSLADELGGDLDPAYFDLERRLRRDLPSIDDQRTGMRGGAAFVYAAPLSGRLALGDARSGMMPTIAIACGVLIASALELRALRRRLRLSRVRSGRCPSCRFPLDGVACTECGIYYFSTATAGAAEAPAVGSCAANGDRATP